jgi:hypothetical protein
MRRDGRLSGAAVGNGFRVESTVTVPPVLPEPVMREQRHLSAESQPTIPSTAAVTLSLVAAPAEPVAPVETSPRPSGKLHYRRLWLNRPGHHGRGHVLSNVHLERYANGTIDVSASYLLADCYRSVTLDFDLYGNATVAERRNGLRKAKLLRESVNAFCDAVEIAYAEHEEAAATKRRKRRRR